MYNSAARLEVKVLEDALEFYAAAFDKKLTSSMMGEYTPFNIDRGAKAREALAQIEELKK